MFKRKFYCTVVLISVLQVFIFNSITLGVSDVNNFNFDSDDGSVVKVNISSYPDPTDLGGILKHKYSYYLLAFKYKGNFYSFNILKAF